MMRKKKSRFFYSIFIPIAIIGSFLIIAFSAYIYKETYESILENLIDEKETFIKQSKNNFEQKVRTVEYAFTTFSSTQTFNNIISKNLDFHDFEVVKEVNSELTYIGIMGAENTEYSLISLTNDWQITDGSLKEIDKEDKNKFITMVNETEESLHWIPEKNSIKMVISLPVFSPSRTSVGIADINTQVIREIINEQKDNFFDIYNKDGMQLFSNTQNSNKQLPTKFLRKIDTNFHNDEGILRDGNDLYIFSKSTYNGWTYVTRLKSSEVAVSTAKLRIGLFLIALLGIFSITFFAYWLANKSTRPIKRIKEKLFVNDGTDHEASEDISQILIGIENIVSQNESLSLKMVHQKPELEQLFVLNLFRNQIPDNELNKYIKQFDYSVTNKIFGVILIQIDDLEGRAENTKDIFLLAIEKIVEDIIPREKRLKPVVLNMETQATVCCLNEEFWKKDLLYFATEIQEAVKKYLKIKVSIGISDSFDFLSEVSICQHNANEALHYRMNLGIESIIFYEDISSQLNEQSTMKYPKDEINKLIDMIRLGDKENIEHEFHEVINCVFANNPNPLSADTALLQLINDILQVGQLLGADYKIFSDSRHIYTKVLHSDNPKKIESIIFTALIYPIVTTIHENTNKELKSISEQIVHLVHQRYDSDLSLDLLAEELHYNPNYLSSVFKKEFGSSFGDFLQNYRLQIAKKWLVDSDMTVKEISERLRYNNSQNFIRFFKKKEGVTPGEFRKNIENH